MHKTFVGSVLAALLVVLVSAVPAAAAFPGANGKIVFSGQRFDRTELDLWAFRDDDTSEGANFFSTDNGNDRQPTWSPDGSVVALVGDAAGNSEIYTAAYGGGTTRRTVNAAEDITPAWSPDGTKIVFASNRDGNFEIYVMNVDGSGATRLTNNPASDTEPAWSPNGTTIAFTSLRDGNSEIYTMDADGSAQTRRTTNASVDKDPNWSPDGSVIAFTSDRSSALDNIWLMDAENGTQGRLSAPTLDGVGESEPAWSPDGKQMVIQLTDADDRIALLNPATGTLQGTFNAFSQGKDFDPDWQPLFPEYARPKAATPKRDPLVLAFRPCVESNTSREGPLSFGACVPAVQASRHLTVGTYEANSRGPNSVGSVQMIVVPGESTTPANEADVRIKISMTDVRWLRDFSDYPGRLGLRTTLRITDHRNLPASGYTRPGTGTDYRAAIDLPCTVTSSLATGSTCALNTTMNTLLPGAVVEGKRAVWEVSDTEVWDGGSSGNNTSQGTLFARTGLFIP